jgi:hypothetical protein
MASRSRDVRRRRAFFNETTLKRTEESSNRGARVARRRSRRLCVARDRSGRIQIRNKQTSTHRTPENDSSARTRHFVWCMTRPSPEWPGLPSHDWAREIRYADGEFWSVGNLLWRKLLMHSVHHRGKLALLCRLAGGVPPGLFGRTREETPAGRVPTPTR